MAPPTFIPPVAVEEPVPAPELPPDVAPPTPVTLPPWLGPPEAPAPAEFIPPLPLGVLPSGAVAPAPPTPPCVPEPLSELQPNAVANTNPNTTRLIMPGTLGWGTLADTFTIRVSCVDANTVMFLFSSMRHHHNMLSVLNTSGPISRKA